MKRAHWLVSVTITLLLIGFFFVLQYRSQEAAENSLLYQNSEDLMMMVISLNEKIGELETEKEAQEQTRANLQAQVKEGSSIASTLENQIKQLSLVTGVVSVEGPGITITITGDSNLLHLDLIDLVNELFVTGAEAVSINDIRIRSTTAITSSSDASGNPIILIGGEVLLSPVVIKAIGEAETLETGLTYTGGIIDNFNIYYNVYPVIKKEAPIRTPASDTPYYKYISQPEEKKPDESETEKKAEEKNNNA